MCDSLEQLRTLSHNLLAQWANDLRVETNIDTGYRGCGGIYLATSAGEAATLSANRLWWDEVGIEAHAWSTQQLVEHEPQLATAARTCKLQAIWWLPGECQVRTPHYVRALAVACRQRGVEIVEACKVNELIREENRVIAIETSHRRYSAQQFCVAAGPWTQALLESLSIRSGILPIRGQVLLYHPGTPLLRSIVNEGHRYLVPRDDGRILVGSNEEEAGFVCETTPAVLAELHNWAVALLPELQTVAIERSWAGLRPGSFDSYPYIGRLPTLENVFVAAGHYRAGIHLSAGTAYVLADLMTSGRTHIDMTPFGAGRG